MFEGSNYGNLAPVEVRLNSIKEMLRGSRTPTQNLALLGQPHTILVLKQSSLLLISNNANILVKDLA